MCCTLSSLHVQLFADFSGLDSIWLAGDCVNGAASIHMRSGRLGLLQGVEGIASLCKGVAVVCCDSLVCLGCLLYSWVFASCTAPSDWVQGPQDRESINRLEPTAALVC